MGFGSAAERTNFGCGVDSFLGFGDGFPMLLIAHTVFQLQNQGPMFFRHASTFGMHNEHAFSLESRWSWIRMSSRLPSGCFWATRIEKPSMPL